MAAGRCEMRESSQLLVEPPVCWKMEVDHSSCCPSSLQADMNWWKAAVEDHTLDFTVDILGLHLILTVWYFWEGRSKPDWQRRGDILHHRTTDPTIRLHGLVTCLENQVVCFVSSWSCYFVKAFSPHFFILQSFLFDVTPSFAVQHFPLATPHKILVVSLHWLTNGQQ